MYSKICSAIDVRRIKLKRRIASFFRRLILNIRPTVKIGSGTLIDSNVKIQTIFGRSKVEVGKDCEIRRGVIFVNDCGGHIIIGNNTSLNPYTILYGHGGLVIGNGVRIAAHSMLVAFNHRFDDDTEIYKQGFTLKGITIEDDVWIGGGVKILDGVTVGKGCIIAAGSVVTKSTEPYSIYGGVPAKFLKSRFDK